MVDLYSAHCGETPSHGRAGGGEWDTQQRVCVPVPLALQSVPPLRGGVSVATGRRPQLPAEVLKQRRHTVVDGPQTLAALLLNSTVAHAMVHLHQVTVASREMGHKPHPSHYPV